MEYSEITLREAIEKVKGFSPVQIIFNDIYLYNDYGEDVVEIKDNIYGEDKPPMSVVPDRIWQFDNYIVTSLSIEIVDYDHSIVKIRGKYHRNNKTEIEEDVNSLQVVSDLD